MLPDGLEDGAHDEDVVEDGEAGEEPVEDGAHLLGQQDRDGDRVGHEAQEAWKESEAIISFNIVFFY